MPRPKNENALMPRIYNYMNKHPNDTIIECIRVFGDENMINVRRCWHDWARYIKPLQFLYFLLSNKFVAIKKISNEEKKKLREIEKRLSLIVPNREKCPYCEKEFALKGIANHKKYCKERPRIEDEKNR